MSGEYLIDTNILVYAYDTSDDLKHELAADIVEDCFSKEASFAVCLQNLSEFFVVVTNKIENKLTVEEARIFIKDFLKFKNLKKLHHKPKTILKALTLVEKYGVHYWDALIAANMLENGIFNIYTENIKDFSRIPGINVINPLKPD